MAQKSSFFLAVLFIANPFMILFFQNCSSAPQAYKAQNEEKSGRVPTSEAKDVVKAQYKNPF